MSGEIYLIKSPSNKIYIGQTIHGYLERWRDHIYDAFDPKKDHCKLLNRAIRKYGKDSFFITLLKRCAIEDLNKYEKFYMSVYNSLKPNGYNLKEGGSNGKHLLETKIKIRDKLKGVPKSQEMRLNLSKSRNKHNLPMYIIKHKNGYHVINHPKQNGRERKITHSKYTDEEKYEIALKYLDYLNNLKEPLSKK